MKVQLFILVQRHPKHKSRELSLVPIAAGFNSVLRSVCLASNSLAKNGCIFWIFCELLNGAECFLFKEKGFFFDLVLN